jgi:hypothetical protein
VPETIGFDVLHFFYLLSLVVIVGGALALGSATAPALFARLERSEAATTFGAVLERWDGVAILAAGVLVVATGLLALNFETGDPLLARWVAVLVVVIGTLYASAWANPIARALRRQTRNFDELPEQAPERAEFARYHRRSRAAMTVAMLAGLVALYFS